MKTILAGLMLFSFVAALANYAEAADRKKKRLHNYGKQYSKVYYRDSDDSIGGYYEHRLDAVRFGSQRWWKIYDEQQGGRRR